MKNLILALLILSCSNLFGQNGFDKNNYSSYFELENYITNSINFDSEVSETCAVFIHPTNRKLEELKKEYGEQDFYTIADDVNWYNSSSMELLEKLAIDIVTLQSGIIRFKGATQTWMLDTDKKGAPAWNFILFKTNKIPVFSSTVDVSESELQNYFEPE